MLTHLATLCPYDSVWAKGVTILWFGVHIEVPIVLAELASTHSRVCAYAQQTGELEEIPTVLERHL